LNVVVSEAGFHEFAEQLEDAVEFLTENAGEVRKLVAFPGVTGAVLDFGIAWRDVVAQSDRFPAELVRLAGASGIALELSHYPVSDGARRRASERARAEDAENPEQEHDEQDRAQPDARSAEGRAREPAAEGAQDQEEQDDEE
jgi:hypothetical protein